MDSWDYVPGLVARSVLKATEYYNTEKWLTAIYSWASAQQSAELFTGTNADSKKDDIDWLNAAKVFADIYKQKGNPSWCETQMTAAVTLLKGSHARIGVASNTAVNSSITDATGGFFHKSSYAYQMWCDGQYMGPAMWAEWLGTFKNSSYSDWESDWADIANQLDIACKYTYEKDEKLFFHGMTAAQTSAYTWTPMTNTYHSQEAWGRGCAWMFAALVDILEYMPAGVDVKANFTYPDGQTATNVDSKTRLTYYLKLMADGLAAKQDPNTYCWPQLLRYDVGTTPSGASGANYIESSSSSMFVYCYLKAVRLGLLSGNTTDKSGESVSYADLAKRGFEGIVKNLVAKQTDGSIQLLQSCESAGLDASRPGTAAYYLGSNNDTHINDATEGKALGPFILAAVEYERAYNPISGCNCLKVTVE